MWYSVLRHELAVPVVPGVKMIRAGSIFNVKKYTEDTILCIPVEGYSAKEVGEFKLPVRHARAFLTTPTKEFNSAVEEAIMQCEANYC